MVLEWNDTLIALVERGPLDAGDIPSKAQCGDLCLAGLAARISVNGEAGFAAATNAGHAAYVDMLGCENFAQAKAKRVAHSAMVRARDSM